jgi:hypothetical protein
MQTPTNNQPSNFHHFASSFSIVNIVNTVNRPPVTIIGSTKLPVSPCEHKESVHLTACSLPLHQTEFANMSVESSNNSNSNARTPTNEPTTPSVPGYWQNAKEWLLVMTDDQRMQRLQQCRELEQVREDCRSGRYERHVEDTSSGLRVTRYFRFKEPDNPATKALCQREEHAVWTCRAMALRCAIHVSKLRECFRDEKEKGSSILAQVTHSSYEGGKQGPCWELQEAMGVCINKNAEEFAQRLEKRRDEKDQ